MTASDLESLDKPRLAVMCRELEATLAEERGRRAMAEAEAAVLRRNARLTHREVVPAGDEEYGYECPVPGCYARVDHPFQQRYCGGCGAKFDWRTYAREGDAA